jgi:hypothetical protein
MPEMKPASGVKFNTPHYDEIQQILNYLQKVTGAQYTNCYSDVSKVYRAKLKQNTVLLSAPTASEIVNTIGATVTWIAIDTGSYVASASSEIFSTGSLSCWAHLGSPMSHSLEANVYITPSGSKGDQCVLKVYDTGSVLTDGFDNLFVEIKIA